MRATLLATTLLAVAIAPTISLQAADPAGVSAQQVARAIERGRKFLLSKQSKNGSWTGYPAQPGAMTALCTLALINAGEDPQSPQIQKSLTYLRQLGKPTKTYATSLQTMVFCAASPDRDMTLIRRNAEWLQAVQVTDGPRKGSWTYSNPGKHSNSGDNSNAQFALLALHEAERVGVKVRGDVWQLALRHWIKAQRESGSFSYEPDSSATGSMTCAGISSLVIASGKVYQTDASVVGGKVQCCGASNTSTASERARVEQAIERGLDWLGRNFSPHNNPTSVTDLARQDLLRKAWVYYYFYGVERVGRLTGRRFFSGKRLAQQRDWYREIAAELVARQDSAAGFWKGPQLPEDRETIATSLALLFLSKGRRPILLAKLKHEPSEDWNRHRGDAANLTHYVEGKWKRDLTWQVVDIRTADTDDLLEAPVLIINGRDGLTLSVAEKNKLREYIDRGGFIFAQDCCRGDGFHNAFTKLVKELFPDTPLRDLPPDHPVWYAQERVPAKFVRPGAIQGVDACCRTSIVYSRMPLSCHWQLNDRRSMTTYPKDVQEAVGAYNSIGINVLAYATGRELKEKLDLLPAVATTDRGSLPKRGRLDVGKLKHAGGSDDAPIALSNLMAAFSQQTGLRVDPAKHLIDIRSQDLAQHPIVFMHGRRRFRLSDVQRKDMADFVKRGGFVFADAICASPQFKEAFTSEMKTVMPAAKWKRLPPDHLMFSEAFGGFSLAKVSLRNPELRSAQEPLKAKISQTAPQLDVLEVDGRIAVVFSPYDLSCALENSPALECKGYLRADAAKLGINILLFALQQ